MTKHVRSLLNDLERHIFFLLLGSILTCKVCAVLPMFRTTATVCPQVPTRWYCLAEKDANSLLQGTHEPINQPAEGWERNPSHSFGYILLYRSCVFLELLF